MAVFQRPPNLDYFPALGLAIVVLLILSAALAIALSAVNVYLRDTEHLLELVLLAWFWMSAIVYPYQLISDRLGPHREWWAVLNPMIPIITTFQKALYNPTAPLRWYTNAPKDPTALAPLGRDGLQHLRPGVPANVLPTKLPDQSPAAIPMGHDIYWYINHLLWVGGLSIVLLLGALWLFGRLEDNLAEEI
jgi:ABC-2 type transport system permease protein